MEQFVKLCSEYGLGVLVFAYFMYMFSKQNTLMAVEREELKQRINKLESEVEKYTAFIQNELMEVLKENTKAFGEMSKSYKDLQDKIGRINRKD